MVQFRVVPRIPGNYIGHEAFPENGGTPGVSPGCYEISCAPVSGCCRSRQDSPQPPFYPCFLILTNGGENQGEGMLKVASTS